MKQGNLHWLYRATTRKKLWLGGAVVLFITVLAELFITLHPHFSVSSIFGFHALFGFVSCVGMVIFAKLLGFFIKRPDDYYDS